MRRRLALLLGLGLTVLLGLPAPHAEVVCDGVDDALVTTAFVNQMLSVSTGTIVAVVKPTGTVTPALSSGCWQGEVYVMDTSLYLELARHSNIDGGDRLCWENYSTTSNVVSGAYTPNAYTHLAWHHTGGTLTAWKDGVALGSVGSGNTGDSLGTPLRLCKDAGSDTAGAKGYLALVATYPTALPAAELQAIGPSRLHRLGWSTPSTQYEFTNCADGASGHNVAFRDDSGNARTLTGNHGAGASGLACAGSTYLTYPWGVE